MAFKHIAPIIALLILLSQATSVSADDLFVDSGQSLGQENNYGLAFGDVDGDGDIDAVTASISSIEPTKIWLNNGSGVFLDSGQNLALEMCFFEVDLADLDNDGDLDAFFANRKGGDRVFYNNGNGVFTDSGQSLGDFESKDIKLADFDGDGDIDAFVINSNPGYTGNWDKLWINDGTGNFSDSGQSIGAPGIGGHGASLVIGDLDNDGDLDVFVGNAHECEIHFNDGSGNFTSTVWDNSGHVSDLAIGDLDGDGDLDIFAAYGGGVQASDRVYLNDGEGNFQYGHIVDIVTQSYGVDLADLDNDGDLDAFVVNTKWSNPSEGVDPHPEGVVWLNDGNAHFSDSGLRLGNAVSRRVLLMDFDSDDDSDAFVANVNGDASKVWLNQAFTPTPVADAGIDLAITSIAQNQTIIQGSATNPNNDEVVQYRWLENENELSAWQTIEIGSDADLDLGTVVDYPIGEYTLTLEVTDGNVTVSDSMILRIEANPAAFIADKVKACWHHDDLHVEGHIALPDSVWMDNLTPAGSADLYLAEVDIANQDLAFRIKGRNGEKWEYKDKKNLNGNIKEFKIDWKGAKFDYHNKLHLHTHFIAGSETSFCIHSDHVSGAFIVNINGTTIAYDENHNITTDVVYEQQKRNNSHVHFILPFQLTSDMVINVTGAIENTINVLDYYNESYGKFKIVSSFNQDAFPNGTNSTPDNVEYFITLGDDMTLVFGGDTVGDDEVWSKKDDKHWEYKLPKK